MEDGAYPVTVSSELGDVVIEAQPTSIVSISPTSTEMLFAIGAGDQVTAVDFLSNYPPEVPAGTLDGFAPDLEAILGAEPDLVVASGLPDDIMAGLGAAGVPVIIQTAATSFDDVFDQIAALGVATGNLDEAAETNADLRMSIDDVLAGLPELDEPVRVFHEIDNSFYTATSATFIGHVYAEMGFENVADPYDDGGGYPLIDGETIIDANPTLIVLPISEYSTYGAADIGSRPGWDGVSAVATGNIVEIDADLASRWGPRIVEFMQAVAELVPVPA
jgi:iron complex transport system substrate-binding protein